MQITIRIQSPIAIGPEIMNLLLRKIRDPHVLGLPDPDPLVKGTDPDPDPSLFS
jgi:hypothetical protein